VKKRKVPSADLKAKFGLEAIRGLKMLNEIAQEYGVHPVQVGQYKKQILSQAGELFDAINWRHGYPPS
jgi:transposase